jgi:hypothetical protein
MVKLYVYSTLSSDVNYTNYAAGGADLPAALEPVHIKGGAGVANDRLLTPRGVMTEITERQAEYLRANPVFQLHEKNGYVQIGAKSIDPEKAAAGMASNDPSAPMTNADIPAETTVSGEGVAGKKR